MLKIINILLTLYTSIIDDKFLIHTLYLYFIQLYFKNITILQAKHLFISIYKLLIYLCYIINESLHYKNIMFNFYNFQMDLSS
jgi:hypothetical protein